MALAGCFDSGMIIKYLLGTCRQAFIQALRTAHIRNYNSPTYWLVYCAKF